MMGARFDPIAVVARLVAASALVWLAVSLLSQSRWMENARRQRRATHAACATIAAALDHYQADHRSYPSSLAQLVPQYLRELPTDGWSHPFFYARWDATMRTPEAWAIASGGADGRLEPPVRDFLAIPPGQPMRELDAAAHLQSEQAARSAADRKPWFEHLNDDVLNVGGTYVLDQPPIDDHAVPPAVSRHTFINAVAALSVLVAALVIDFLRFRARHARRQEIVT